MFLCLNWQVMKRRHENPSRAPVPQLSQANLRHLKHIQVATAQVSPLIAEEPTLHLNPLSTHSITTELVMKRRKIKEVEKAMERIIKRRAVLSLLVSNTGGRSISRGHLGIVILRKIRMGMGTRRCRICFDFLSEIFRWEKRLRWRVPRYNGFSR